MKSKITLAWSSLAIVSVILESSCSHVVDSTPYINATKYSSGNNAFVTINTYNTVQATFRTKGRRAPMGRQLLPDKVETRGRDPILFLDASRVRPESTVASHDGGGQVAQTLSYIPGAIGLDVSLLAYTDASVQLNTPTPIVTPLPGPDTPYPANYLYDPTAHVAGSCFEVGIKYERDRNSAAESPPELNV